MNTQTVIKEFRQNLGPLESKQLQGMIQVNRRWYEGVLGTIELCVTTYYQDREQVSEVGIYWEDPTNPNDISNVEKYAWLEPEISDIIEEMKAEFTEEEILNHLTTKVAFYKVLEETANGTMSEV